MPTAIYHYTSVAALIPIATADELWLSDTTFLNDRAEINHGVAVAAARLQAAKDHETDDRVRAMLTKAAGLLASEPSPPVYVCCFSIEQDDLGQWRGYGRGAPVAIKFHQWQLMFGYSQGVFGEVRYDLGEQAWSFDQLIEAYRAACRVDLDDPVLPPPRRKEPMTPEEERGYALASFTRVSCRRLRSILRRTPDRAREPLRARRRGATRSPLTLQSVRQEPHQPQAPTPP